MCSSDLAIAFLEPVRVHYLKDNCTINKLNSLAYSVVNFIKDEYIQIIRYDHELELLLNSIKIQQSEYKFEDIKHIEDSGYFVFDMRNRFTFTFKIRSIVSDGYFTFIRYDCIDSSKVRRDFE